MTAGQKLKAGKKTKEWFKAKKSLILEYKEKGITRCEISGTKYNLQFHHRPKRSSQQAKHDFEHTRLLTQEWHDIVEEDDELDKLLFRKARGFDPEFYEIMKKKKADKKKVRMKKAGWQVVHSCIHCKQKTSMLLCEHCGKISIK